MRSDFCLGLEIQKENRWNYVEKIHTKFFQRISRQTKLRIKKSRVHCDIYRNRLYFLKLSSLNGIHSGIWYILNTKDILYVKQDPFKKDCKKKKRETLRISRSGLSCALEEIPLNILLLECHYVKYTDFPVEMNKRRKGVLSCIYERMLRF